MAKTLANLRTGARIYLDESQQADFLDTEVDKAINYGYHDVVKHVMGVYEEFYVTTTPYKYTMVEDQQEYTIASSLIKVTRVEINYNPDITGSTATRALPIKTDEVRMDLASQSANNSYFNAGYYLHGNIGAQKIGFVPVPAKSDTTAQSISVWGVDLPADLSSATDNVNIPYADNFSQLVELFAASYLLSKGQQAQLEADGYYRRYKLEIKEMQTFLKERQADSMWMIQDAFSDTLDFSSLGYY